MSGDQNSPLLECRSVTKRFGALVAVGNLSLELNANEILGIGGPNGAGKTTLFDLISGVVSPDEGGIFLNGQDIRGRPAHDICHLGMARTFQANAAFNSLTAFENVYVAAQFGNAHGLRQTLRSNPEFVERSEQELEFVGLTQNASTLAAELPAFDRKRLMIASALASNAKCLLMDEPVGGLVPKEIDTIMELVRRIRSRGIAIILIEHVMRFLVTLSDRILIMQQGQKLFLGPPAEMVTDKDVTRVYLGQRASDRMQALLAKGAR